MLWTMYTCIIGLILMNYSKKHHYESSVMGIYSMIASFLIMLAVVKNPFVHVWQTWPQNAQAGFMPDDGRGLNPLLQNFWIVIHPPILFLGFASTAVPFANAMSGLLRKDYKSGQMLLYHGRFLHLRFSDSELPSAAFGRTRPWAGGDSGDGILSRILPLFHGWSRSRPFILCWYSAARADS